MGASGRSTKKETKMKRGAVTRIRQMLTPKVMINSCNDHNGKITGVAEHIYRYPHLERGTAIPWSRRFSFEADRDGNIISTNGLF
jgi:hypothetical protein